MSNVLQMNDINVRSQKRLSEVEGTKIFQSHAFNFLAHRCRIMKDSRMFLAQVPVSNGPFPFDVCLGAYLEWWLQCDADLRMSEEGKLSLVFRLAGSPCSGSNSCTEVFEDGSSGVIHLYNFMNIFGKLKSIASRYTKYTDDCESYSLEKVIEILKKEDASDNSSAEDYRILFLMAKVRKLEAELKRETNEYEKLSKKHIHTLLQWKDNLVTLFYKDYRQMADKLNDEVRELRERRSELKIALKSGKMTGKECQPLFSKIKKRLLDIEREKTNYERNRLNSIFPGEFITISQIEDYLAHK